MAFFVGTGEQVSFFFEGGGAEGRGERGKISFLPCLLGEAKGSWRFLRGRNHLLEVAERELTNGTVILSFLAVVSWVA